MRHILFCCLLFLSVSLEAQIYPFRNYNLIDGLPESHIKAILEDHNSYMWFATEGGACKFDGREFTQYSTEHGLLSNNVNHIIEDSKKRIWLATRVGVSRFDGKRFHNLTDKQGLVNNDVYYIMEDKEGSMWFATTSGVSKLDGKKFKNFNTFDGLPSDKVWCIMEDKKGDIWFGTSNGIARYNGISFKNFGPKEGLPSSYVNCIIKDQKENLWFGTARGLARFESDGTLTTVESLEERNIFSGRVDVKGKLWLGTPTGVVVLNTKTLKIEEALTTNNGLLNNQVNYITQDRNQNYWFGTDAGISKLTNRRFNILFAPEVTSKAITAIIEDGKKNMWFGTRGGGLVQYDGEDFIAYTIADGLASNYVKAVYEAKDGNLWVGTTGGGVSRFDGETFTNYNQEDGLTDNYVYTIVEDYAGRIWLGTDECVIRFDGDRFSDFTAAQGLADNYVRCSLRDQKGNLWFGTYGGLSKYDPNSGFANFTTKNGLANNLVLSMIEDRQGVLWLATENGLCKMRYGALPSEPDCFECFTKKDNLTSQNLWSLVEDKAGNIWVGHRNGIERFNPQQGDFKYYGYVDGFKLIQTFPNAVTKDSKGNIWFGAFDGVVQYDPTEDKRNNIPPTTHITDIKLFNKKVDWKQYTQNIDIDFGIPKFDEEEGYNLLLDHDQNHITFEFVGIHFTIPERVKYQFKLEGFDKDWSDLTNKNTATYTNLPPGDYVFKIKAANSDGVFNKEYTRFSFKIEKPYWERWWFYASELAFFITLLIISIYLSARRRGSKLTLILSITTLLIFFEFINVYIEDYIEGFLGNIPVYKVLANVLIASALGPIEHLLRNTITTAKPSVRPENEGQNYEEEEMEAR
ncbi:MAG: two-component regulator propeller domain-containing protein [Thermonemataceae bacterium]